MAVDLRGRSLLSLVEETPEEIRHLLDLSAELKAAKKAGAEERRLVGKNVALIFEKTSTRTRSSFEVAAHDQGASTTFLEPKSTQIGHKESIKDTARVLGRMFDAIQYRGSEQSVVQELAEYAGVPVYNGLTDDWHPTQMLADVLTMVEHVDKPLEQIAYAYVGDARNNMGNSLLLIGAKLGMDVRIGAPKALQPTDELVAQCREIAAQTGARLTLTEDPVEAVRGVEGSGVRERRQPVPLQMDRGHVGDDGHEREGDQGVQQGEQQHLPLVVPARRPRGTRRTPRYLPQPATSHPLPWPCGPPDHQLPPRSGTPRRSSTTATCRARTVTCRGTTRSRAAGTPGRRTSSSTDTRTTAPGAGHGRVEQSTVSAAGAGRKPWSRSARATVASACRRARSSSRPRT